MKSNQKQKKRKPEPAYTKNKKAFDAVITHFRRMGRPQLGAIVAMNFEKAGGSPSAKNPSAPTPVDFGCDVILAVTAAMPKGITLESVKQAYFEFDSDDEIERNVYAGKILKGRVHSVEQRLGAEFVRRAIWPLTTYFHPPRIFRSLN